MGDAALLLSMPNSVAEQALINACAVLCQVPIPFAPLAPFMVLFGAMLPPVRKIVEAGVEYGSWDIQGHRGIMEDAWLEAAEGIGMCQGMQRVVFFPSCIVI
jgi:hypothetical protein